MIIFFIVVAIVAVWGVKLYNSLKGLAEAVRSRRANIFAVTKKRADLAAQLVNIAENYGSHEKLSHFQVSEDLTSIAGLASVNKKADRMINQVVSMAQNFPDLKANQTYQQLMQQLEKIEAEILQRRETYNQVVERYNAHRVRVPQVFVANLCHFGEAPYFEVNAEGLDDIAVFHTGDTKALEDVMRRAGTRAQAFAKQASAYARSHNGEAVPLSTANAGYENELSPNGHLLDRSADGQAPGDRSKDSADHT